MLFHTDSCKPSEFRQMPQSKFFFINKGWWLGTFLSSPLWFYLLPIQIPNFIFYKVIMFKVKYMHNSHIHMLPINFFLGQRKALIVLFLLSLGSPNTTPRVMYRLWAISFCLKYSATTYKDLESVMCNIVRPLTKCGVGNMYLWNYKIFETYSLIYNLRSGH